MLAEQEMAVTYALRYPPHRGITVARFLELVERHFVTHRDPVFYAAELDISSRHLSRICIQRLSKTPYECIQERLLLEAERLLLYTEMSVKEICYELGYCDPAHFSRCFKRREGVSPSGYREANRCFR